MDDEHTESENADGSEGPQQLSLLEAFDLVVASIPPEHRHRRELYIVRSEIAAQEETVAEARQMIEKLERDTIIRIDPHFVAGFEGSLHQLGGTLEDQRLQSMFGANPEPIGPDDLGDFRDGSCGLET